MHDALERERSVTGHCRAKRDDAHLLARAGFTVVVPTMAWPDESLLGQLSTSPRPSFAGHLASSSLPGLLQLRDQVRSVDREWHEPCARLHSHDRPTVGADARCVIGETH